MDKIARYNFKIWKESFLPVCSRFYSACSDRKKICIVGSGPAGFYTAQHILSKSNLEVDIFEKLPIPFGLIRYGVAPDHPEIKVVTNTFTKIAQDVKCNFFGNVNVGCDIRLTELLTAYNAVVLAYGASNDKVLRITGEDSQNVFPARSFVNWYNGHPEHTADTFDLDTEVATVIGHGNVALDVARILLRNTDELKVTDIADYAMETLLKSRIKKVVLIGRRGPLQVSFTIKELREMIKLNGCSTVMSSKDFEGIPDLIPGLPRSRKRLVELLYKTAVDKETKTAGKILEMKFFRSPKSISLDEHGKVRKLILGVNTIEGAPEDAKVISTDEEEEIECGLVLRSVGYQSTPIDPELPFDETKCIVPNKEGKVLGHEGLYCSGWIKTGPTGVILSTMNGSYETAEKLLLDMDTEKCFQKECSGSQTILKTLRERGVKFTTFDDWKKIDNVELERGKAVGKSRQKICNKEDMLRIAGVH